MNWYNGNIAEAVAKSKANNAIFVVYVEGHDDSTKKLSDFINDQRIRGKLESEDFVAIKIESDSQAYMQFATIYQVVPVPSIFFIGKSGTPLDIATGIIASVQELEEKINKVLTSFGRATSSASSTTSLIEAEQKSHNASSSISTTTSTREVVEKVIDLTSKSDSSANDLTTNVVDKMYTDDDYEVVCEGDVCYKKLKDDGKVTENEEQRVQVPAVSANENMDSTPTTNEKKERENEKQTNQEAGDTSARLEDARKKMEEQRRKRIEEEKKLKKELELKRRREGKEMQNLQQWQHEKELKELKDNIRREKLEEIAVRERIRTQIAADRVERAQKFSPKSGDNAATTSADAAANSGGFGGGTPSLAPDSTRIQFRFASGSTATKVFNCQDTFNKVREYVRVDLLPGTGIKDFTLATTYPKRELDIEHDEKTLGELQLFPSAVILIIGKESKTSPSAIIARTGGLINMFTTIVMTILTPVFSIFGYLKNMATGQRGRNDGEGSGANKRANEDNVAHHDAAKRRNMDRFSGGGTAVNATSTNSPTTSADAAADQDESKPYRRYGGSNIHRLTDHKDSDDENATWNGNSTQQQ